jgi:hypothetical protein
LFGVAVGKLELARVRERKGEGGLGRGTYTGWCHAGGVYLMWGASAGGKYSFNCVRAVEEKFLLELKLSLLTTK